MLVDELKWSVELLAVAEGRHGHLQQNFMLLMAAVNGQPCKLVSTAFPYINVLNVLTMRDHEIALGNHEIELAVHKIALAVHKMTLADHEQSLGNHEMTLAD